MAHVCISNTSRAGAELGFDMSVVRDVVGDRYIPGATATELVEVGVMPCFDSSAHSAADRVGGTWRRLCYNY